MSFWNLELLPVHRILVLEMNPVFVISGQAQIVFVQADGILVLEQNAYVPFSELLQNLKIASSCYFVP
jgi:hypothetical protein